MKRVSVMLIAFALLISLCGFAAADSFSIEGEWTLIDFHTGDEETDAVMKMVLDNGTMTMIFKEDGTYSLDVEFMGQTNSQTGTWILIGTSLIMDGSVTTLEIDGDTITINEDGSTMTMVRAGAQGAINWSQYGSYTDDGTGLFGQWKMEAIETEDAETQNIYDLILSYGSATLSFDNGVATRLLDIFGNQQSQEMTYELIEANRLLVKTDDDFMIVEYSIVGDTLTWNNTIAKIVFTFSRIY